MSFNTGRTTWLRLSLPLALLLAMPSGISAAGMACNQFEELGLALAGARDSNPAEGVDRGEKALAEVEKLQDPCPTGTAMLLGGIASNLQILGRNAEAIEQYAKALEVLQGGGTPTQIAFLHRGYGVALVDVESYQSALEHYLTALGYSDDANEPIESAKTSGNIGILYTSIGELIKARDYHARSLAGFEKAGFKPGVAGALINLGVVAAKFGQQAMDEGDVSAARREHQTLLKMNEGALALFSELGNSRGVAYATSNIGLALDRLGQPLKALPHHQRSLSIRTEVGDVFGTINSLLSIARTMTNLQRYEEAVAALDEAESKVPEDSFNLHKEVAAQRVVLTEVRGDFRAALAAQREVTRLGMLSADATQRSELAALQDRFDAHQAAKQIDFLRSEGRIGELQLQRQRLVAKLSALIAALAIGFFLVLLSRYRIGVRSAQNLALAARTDPLTGLPNRRHLLELMNYEATRLARDGRSFCLLMADLDDFKAINDSYGHDAGDAVLYEVGQRLRDAVRKQDTVARWGGEEFLLLLPDSTEGGATLLANKLRDRISGEPFVIGRDRVPVTMTVTLGLSECRKGTSLDDCLRAADMALYQGKREGKNRAAFLQHEEPAHNA